MKKLIEMKLDDEVDGVFAISIVSDPAIQSDFLALSDSKILLKVEDEEKRILTGAILIPNLPILRLDENNEPYHIFFSKETVNEISQRYLKNKNQDSVTVEHQVDTEDVTLIESWIKADENHDKSVALGIDVPVGTWLGTMKVDNDDLWNDFIKAGHLKGFSIEARMKAEEVSEIDNNLKSEKMEDNFMNHIKSYFSKEEPVKDEEVKVEMASKEDFVELCAKVDALTETLTEALKQIALKEEVKEEVELSPDKVSNEVEIKEEEEEKQEAKEVEMVAHTDADEEIQLSDTKEEFNYKLTPQQRIELAMKRF